MVAALLVGELVPDAVAHSNDGDALRKLTPSQYEHLSTGERAAYDIARDFWIEGGPLTRFALNADAHFANALLTAVHVVLGPAIMRDTRHPAR